MSTSRSFRACVVAVLLLAAFDPSVDSQGVRGRAQVAKPATAPDVNMLRQQILALEHRVAELEKVKVVVSGTSNQTSVETPYVRKLEQRVAALEREIAAGGNARAAAQTVRAPFSVVDDRGKIVFRVDLEPTNNRARAIVGDPAGPRVHLGPNGGGGASVGLYHSAESVGAFMVTTPKESYINVKNEQRSVTLTADHQASRVQAWNNSGIAVATLQSSVNGHGFMALADSAGDVRVDAGTQADGVGTVRASGPGGGGVSAAPGMPSSFIRGWRK